jgi:PAS domain S-box-containing protein
MQSRAITHDEIVLAPGDTIQSRTDARGVITSVNATFERISGYSADELIGKPHNIVRHQHMPRSVYAIMWQMIQRGEEFFGFVKNRAKNGDHYWVFTRVSARRDASGEINGYMSIRVAPPAKREAIAEWDSVYAQVCTVEAYQPRDKQIAAGTQAIVDYLASRGHSSLTSYVMKQV